MVYSPKYYVSESRTSAEKVKCVSTAMLILFKVLKVSNADNKGTP